MLTYADVQDKDIAQALATAAVGTDVQILLCRDSGIRMLSLRITKHGAIRDVFS
jgi:hypothetical protein